MIAEQPHHLGEVAAPDGPRFTVGYQPGSSQDLATPTPGEHHDEFPAAQAGSDHVPAGSAGLYLHRPAVVQPGPADRGNVGEDRY